MKDWLFGQRLKYHAWKHDSALDIRGIIPYAQLTFGLQRGALWRVGRNSVLATHGIISLGKQARCIVSEQCRIGLRWQIKMMDCKHGACINIGKQCRMEDDVKLSTFGAGKIIIEDHCFIGCGSILAAHKSIEIGEGSAIAEYVSIRDHNHKPHNGPVHHSPMQVAPVRIGRRVWIGGKVTIIAGVTIGDNAVVGANAVVTRNVAAGERVAGVPARPIGSK